MTPMTDGVQDIEQCPFVCLSQVSRARSVSRPKCDSQRRRAIKPLRLAVAAVFRVVGQRMPAAASKRRHFLS